VPRLAAIALSTLASVCLAAPALTAAVAPALAQGTESRTESRPETHAARDVKHAPTKEIGKASVYSTWFQGRHMTDGERYNARSDAAASRTLPIGTKAKVVDLQTGKVAKVVIKDHGPAPKSRIIDLTPHTAAQIGLTKKQGIAPVEVVPTSIPAKPIIHKAEGS